MDIVGDYGLKLLPSKYFSLDVALPEDSQQEAKI